MTDEQQAAERAAAERDPSERPVLRVVRGSPTPEELAALVAVLAAAASSSPSPPGPHAPESIWNDRARAVRAPLSPSPRAWRASGLPS
ncbi:MAG: acyl-CoA carboxylase subunit epsilon [Actinomycetes bacterium]